MINYDFTSISIQQHLTILKLLKQLMQIGFTCSAIPTLLTIFVSSSNLSSCLYQPVRTLRSSTSALLVIPFVRSDFASDAFSVSSPILWNNLPQLTNKS